MAAQRRRTAIFFGNAPLGDPASVGFFFCCLARGTRWLAHEVRGMEGQAIFCTRIVSLSGVDQCFVHVVEGYPVLLRR